MPMIEHVVLFNVKDEADPESVTAWIAALNSLSTLPTVLHLTAGPILRTRRHGLFPAGLRFTHLLYARYGSKPDLESYSNHPSHLRVVDELGLPIMDDVMALDWESESAVRAAPAAAVHPGRAMRFTCFSFKEGEGGEKRGKEEVVVAGLKKIKDMGEREGLFEEMSFGEEVSVGRAKGFTVAAMAVFSDLNELDACEEFEDEMRSLVDKGKAVIDGVVAVDYLVPRK